MKIFADLALAAAYLPPERILQNVVRQTGSNARSKLPSVCFGSLRSGCGMKADFALGPIAASDRFEPIPVSSTYRSPSNLMTEAIRCCFKL